MCFQRRCQVCHRLEGSSTNRLHTRGCHPKLTSLPKQSRGNEGASETGGRVDKQRLHEGEHELVCFAYSISAKEG